jgi:hypothetical protein
MMTTDSSLVTRPQSRIWRSPAKVAAPSGEAEIPHKPRSA